MALLWLQHVVLLAVTAWSCAAAAPSDAFCPRGCQCVWLDLVCDNAGFTAIPGGQWSYVWDVFLSGNSIATVSAADLDGLPKLSVLYLNNNSLSVLDLGVFAAAQVLTDLRVANNDIRSVVAPPEGVRLQELEYLTLSSNRLEALDPHVFDAAPALRYLYLDGNPLLLPADKPLLVHDTIQVLFLDGAHASGLSSVTLSALPNLDTLSLNASDVSDLSGVFSTVPRLSTLHASGSAVATLPADAFAPAARVRRLDLSRSRLATVAPGALSALADGALLDVSDTPLACACAFGDLRQWALRHGGALNASCRGAAPCAFDASA